MRFQAHREFAKIHSLETRKSAMVIFKIDTDDQEVIKDFIAKVREAKKNDRILFVPNNVTIEVIYKKPKRKRAK